MSSNPLYQKLDEKKEYQKYLYRFGYVITDFPERIDEKFNFLNTWKLHQRHNIQFLVHPHQKIFFCTENNTTFFLIGHCYNPIRMMEDENDVLRVLAQVYNQDVSDYTRYLSELTGVFVTGYLNNTGITVYGDAAGMLITYYGCVENHIWVSSHADLIGNLTSLEQDPYVRKLTQYKFYSLFGYSLPGDLSPYKAFKRLVPNHSVNIQDAVCTVKRFYPYCDRNVSVNRYSDEERIAKIAKILQNSMKLIALKWNKPAISLTGGCDSKTTLACASDYYEKFRFFSYISQETEQVDADGAHTICDALGLRHKIHYIPAELQEHEDFELVRDIISANQGNIGKLPAHEVRKRMYFSQIDEFDVEVKSWVSEIGRAYYHKRFQKKTFPTKPSPRYLTTLYKVFMHDRRLVKETDHIFENYITEYLDQDKLFGWNWIDLLFWEFRVSSWNGLVITGEHRYSFDITIPYNNRELLELLLAVPVETRIDDALYRNVRAMTNPAIDASGVAITNLKHTSNRAKIERMYLEVHSKLPI